MYIVIMLEYTSSDFWRYINEKESIHAVGNYSCIIDCDNKGYWLKKQMSRIWNKYNARTNKQTWRL